MISPTLFHTFHPSKGEKYEIRLGKFLTFHAGVDQIVNLAYPHALDVRIESVDLSLGKVDVGKGKCLVPRPTSARVVYGENARVHRMIEDYFGVEGLSFSP